MIYNIEPRTEDPLTVDDFESYGGLLNLLLDSWSTNKDSGCKMNISLSDEVEMAGGYSTLVNGGDYYRATCLVSMKDRDGRELYREPEPKQIYSAAAASENSS